MSKFFQKGVPRPPNAGRKKGSPNKVKPMDLLCAELEVELGRTVEPGKLALMLGAGVDPCHKGKIVPLSIRMDAIKTSIKYVRPALANMELSGKDGGPIMSARLDMNNLMQSEEAVTALEDLIVQAAVDARVAMAEQEAGENEPESDIPATPTNEEDSDGPETD